MASSDSSSTPRNAAGYHISSGPLAPPDEGDYSAGWELGELPRVYGAPLLFAMARDPRTLFAYWNIDWSTIFAQGEPADRQVYLRVKKADGTEVSESVIEPMLGSYYAGEVQPDGAYRVELGYYDGKGEWHSVTSSSVVTMPREGASDNAAVDVATVPFHLSFQRLVDLFRAANGDALTAIMSRLQSRALTEAERELLTSEEWEILRAMNLSVENMAEAWRGFADREDENLLRKRTEAILGFGATSPAHGFGASSPSSLGS
jgi:hypothetical protein